MFQPFCFYVCFVFGVFWLFLFCVFVLCFCFVLLSVYDKNCFPCNSGVSWVMLVKRVVWFLCFMFLFLFVFLVLFLSILKNSFVLRCFCVVFFCHKTSWSSCLHLVLLFSFLLFCFEFLFVFFFCFFIPLKKRPPKKTGHSKNPKKTKMQKNRTKKISAVVFTKSVLQFLGVGLKFAFLAENTIKIVVLACFSNR